MLRSHDTHDFIYLFIHSSCRPKRTDPDPTQPENMHTQNNTTYYILHTHTYILHATTIENSTDARRRRRIHPSSLEYICIQNIEPSAFTVLPKTNPEFKIEE
mmetsp:Transcript_19065/g.21556  ORF Transcript_19065/g.21556 Transcript_19065/m.21556 type:complete len:102 (-) Transcript_19065:83-388(-)